MVYGKLVAAFISKSDTCKGMTILVYMQPYASMEGSRYVFDIKPTEA